MHMQDDLILRILFEGTFSLDFAHIIMPEACFPKNLLLPYVL